MSREAIIAEARRWIGTPYRHAAAVRGLGCDCLGLVIGVRRAVCGAAAVPPVPPYPPDWAEATGEERLTEALGAVLRPIDPARAQGGDVVLFRLRVARPAAHAAFLTEAGTLIHAHARIAVVEVPFGPAWRRRLAAAFVFPENW
jgi:NlpC/P60 family putative phage cell wall peptidase